MAKNSGVPQGDETVYLIEIVTKTGYEVVAFGLDTDGVKALIPYYRWHCKNREGFLDVRARDMLSHPERKP